MAKYTVIVGGFDEFPGDWVEVRVEADDNAKIDIQAAALWAYNKLWMLYGGSPPADGPPATFPTYDLVGCYEGWLVCV